MAYRKTLAGEVTTRLRFSIKNDVNTRARSQLAHNLDIFYKNTGYKPRGSQGVLPPEGMDEDEERVFNDILSRFLEDSRSAKEIHADYAKLPTSEKAKTTKEMSEEIEKAERIANDARLHKELYSNIIKEIFDLTKDNKWNTTSVYNAMIDTLDEIENDIIGDSEDDYIQSVIDKIESGFY